MRQPFHIRRRSWAELATPAPPGGRHMQMVRLALSLLGQGLSPYDVFAKFRGDYAPDVSDREIWGVIHWAERKNPQPYRPRNRFAPIKFKPVPPPVSPPTPDEVKAAAHDWLKGFSCGERAVSEMSPWRPLENWRYDAMPLLAALYDAGEKIAITTNLCGGPDRILTRDEWFAALRDDGPPQSDAGAWIRMNPVTGASGGNNTVTDSDVSACRFILLECDSLPLDLQLSILVKLSLPIAAIVTSGGRSLHAWVKVDCTDAATYRETAGKIFRLLAHFGFDAANKNPGRAARLPGALRSHWDKDRPEPPGRDSRQRLLYLNPEPIQQPIFP